MNRHDALTWATTLIDISEARLLLSAAIPCSRAQLVTQADEALTPAVQQTFESWVKARQLGQPIAYLLKSREFFGLSFAVDSRVLIPRHETELLVELAMELTPLNSRVLELGTGSGAIAIALAHNRPDLSITAIDYAADALECARANAQTHGVTIDFRHSNWGEALTNDAPFAMIVSNPPYIAAHDRHLSQGDCRFEPMHALTDGSTDGLDAIRTIIDFAQRHSAKNSAQQLSTQVLLEHGFDQAPEVRELMQQHHAQEVRSWCDLAGIERITGGVFHTGGVLHTTV